MPAGFVLAVIGVFCPWYSASAFSHSAYGSASMAASYSGWWTIPGILTALVAVLGMILGLLGNRALLMPVIIIGLIVVLLGVWGMFYAPSATSSAEFGGYGSAHGRAGWSWGVFVTLAGGAIAAISGFLSVSGARQRRRIYGLR